MWKILGEPFSKIIEAVGGVLDKVTTTDEERSAIKLSLLNAQKEIQEKLIEADSLFAQAQRDVIVAEAKSEGVLARNWRPILMLTFTYIVFHNFVLTSLFSITPVPIPEPMWELLKLGVGGYVMGRSAEKISDTVAPAVAEILKNKK